MIRVLPDWNDDAEAAEDITKIRRSLPAPAREAVRIEVDLDAVVDNARAVQEKVGIGTGVLALLKANAYGHGLVPVAMALHHGSNITGFVVTTIAEALQLVALHTDRPVICAAPAWDGRYAEVLQRGILPVIASLRDLRHFAHAARRSDLTCRVHLQVGGGGIETDVDAVLDALRRAPELELAALATPLDILVDRVAYARVCARFLRAGHRPATIDAGHGSDHVRAGLDLFGGAAHDARLVPALRLVTRIVQLRELGAREELAPGDQSWCAVRPTMIATLPVGHMHGYPRRLAGKPEALVRGLACPIVGVVADGMMHVDVTDLMFPVLGDEAVLFGEQGREAIFPQDVAASVDEMFSGLGRDVPRDYIRHGQRKPDGSVAVAEANGDVFGIG